MHRSRARAHLAAIVVTAGLAVAPAGALAQGAGDDQYTDPFQSTSTTKAPATKAPAPKPTVTKRPQAPATSAQPTPAQTAAPTATPAAPATATPSAAPAATSAEPMLARTGFDTRLVLLAGVALMAGGAALRLRLR